MFLREQLITFRSLHRQTRSEAFAPNARPKLLKVRNYSFYTMEIPQIMVASLTQIMQRMARFFRGGNNVAPTYFFEEVFSTNAPVIAHYCHAYPFENHISVKFDEILYLTIIDCTHFDLGFQRASGIWAHTTIA